MKMRSITDLRDELDKNWKVYDDDEKLELTMKVIYELGMIEENIRLLDVAGDDPIMVEMIAEKYGKRIIYVI